MKGFAGQGDRFSAMLTGLRGALLDIGVESSQLAPVGERIEPFQRSGSFDQFDQKPFYSRSETDLGAILDNELRRPAGPSLALVITDGVMSLQTSQGKTRSLLDCQRGSDVECLAVKMGKLIQAGRGVWVLGLRSAFRGTLYSERLKAGGGSLGDVNLTNRPFYLWVITDHPASGRRLIERLFQRISEHPDGQRSFALELAPGDIRWWISVPDEAPESDSKLFPSGATQGAARGKFAPAAGSLPSTQEAVSQNLDGTAFGLKIPLQETALTTIPKEVTPLWAYHSNYCLHWEGKAPPGALRVQAREDGRTLRFALLSPSFVGLAGRHVTVVERMVRTGDGHEIIRRLESWSTDDDRKIAAGSRTLNLLGFLESLVARLEPAESFEQPLLRIDFK
ncbi:MAG TPA: hypothetical protein VH988_27030 [Thermoanaerobaculia bacterium]|jgi:hypothetical protein|nr:hypothetical protein [Thermoanaerobaculia bacterium]